MQRVCVAAAIGVLSLAIAPLSSQAPKPAARPAGERILAPIPLDEALRSEGISVLEPSPDRKLLAFTLSDMSRRVRMHGAAFSESGLPSTQSGARVRLTDVRTGRTDAIADDPEGRWASWAPSWSPDGAWLAFVSNRDGSPRIWRWERRTGRTTRVAEVIVIDPMRRSTLEKWRLLQWAPDGRTIVTRVLPEGMDPPAIARYSSLVLRGREAVADDRPTATVYPRGQDTAGGASRKPGQPDAVLMRRHDQFLGDIAAVDVDSGHVRRLVRRAHAERYDLSPDGRHVALHDVRTLRIAAVDTGREGAVDTSEPDVLPNVELSWAPDSASAVHVVRGVRRRVSIDGRVERLPAASDESPNPAFTGGVPGNAHDRARLAAAATGQAQFYRYQDGAHYPNVWVAEPNASGPRQLTHLGAVFERYELGEQRLIDWITDDGDRRRGVLLLPAGHKANTRVPLIVLIYGDTTSVQKAFETFGIEGPHNNMQILASRGYAVLYPESELQVGTPMLDLVKNVLPGVSKCVELGIADERRLGIMGTATAPTVRSP